MNDSKSQNAHTEPPESQEMSDAEFLKALQAGLVVPPKEKPVTMISGLNWNDDWSPNDD